MASGFSQKAAKEAALCLWNSCLAGGKGRGVYHKGAKAPRRTKRIKPSRAIALSLADRRFKADGRVTAEEGDTLQAIKKILG
jgi:hypothetical protein